MRHRRKTSDYLGCSLLQDIGALSLLLSYQEVNSSFHCATCHVCHLTENPKSAGAKRHMTCLKLSQINLPSTKVIKISGSRYRTERRSAKGPMRSKGRSCRHWTNASHVKEEHGQLVIHPMDHVRSQREDTVLHLGVDFNLTASLLVPCNKTFILQSDGKGVPGAFISPAVAFQHQTGPRQWL